MYEKPSCLVSCTYQYVPVRTGHLFLYWSVPVCTCTYKYIPVRTILPDPVQVYRIPDVYTRYIQIYLKITELASSGNSDPIIGYYWLLLGPNNSQ